MRITMGLVAILVGLGVPAMALAADEVANFEARWPEAPMREADALGTDSPRRGRT